MALDIPDNWGLTGKVAIVTGGGGGIGQVYGRALADAGAAVVLADIKGEHAERAAAEVREGGASVLGVQVDITGIEPP